MATEPLVTIPMSEYNAYQELVELVINLIDNLEDNDKTDFENAKNHTKYITQSYWSS